MKQDMLQRLIQTISKLNPTVEPQGYKISIQLPINKPTQAPQLIGNPATWDTDNLLFTIKSLQATTSYLKPYIEDQVAANIARFSSPTTTVNNFTMKCKKLAREIELLATSVGFEIVENHQVFNKVNWLTYKPLIQKKSILFSYIRLRSHEATRMLDNIVTTIRTICPNNDTTVTELYNNIPVLEVRIREAM